jgi:hypothetical protein
MKHLINVPWLIAAVVLYSLVAIFGHFPSEEEAAGGQRAIHVFATAIAHFTMPSGATWELTKGDLVVVFTLAVLFIELLKSTRPGTVSFVDHSLSLIVFIVCLLEFILWKRAATSVFFIIILATLIDVLAGFSISVRAARRDMVMTPPDHLG